MVYLVLQPEALLIYLLAVNCVAVPEQPRDLRGEAVSSTSIRVVWSAPHTVGSDPVTSYKLYYNDSTRRQNVQLTILARVNSYLIEDLSPNTVYHIRLSATTSHGEGPMTAAVSVRTDEDGELVLADFGCCKTKPYWFFVLYVCVWSFLVLYCYSALVDSISAFHCLHRILFEVTCVEWDIEPYIVVKHIL